MTEIFTGWWFGRYPEHCIKIGVSRGVPRGMAAGYRRYTALNPGEWFKTASVHDYWRLYFEHLRTLDPQKVVDDIVKISGGKTPILCCYESPLKDEEWCHRSMISVWLSDKLGLEVLEFGFEDRGFGLNHPKLPHQFRARPAPPAIDVDPYLGATATDREGRTWTVVGRDTDHPDQALVECADGARRPISAAILHEKFQPVG